uniref:Ig-like domain-containing protein n=1 Tax=Cyprinus carpio carpio TaxID=630221 RepID=A0A8C0YGE5_CYPCA
YRTSNVSMTVISVQNEMFHSEGANITLSCNFSSAYTLQWYRQYPGQAPKYLIVILYSTGKVSQRSEIVDQDPRFSGKLNDKKTHVDLEISSAAVSDSALYYCALQPTVKGNTTTQYKN